jgi:hypothetical protein
MGAANARAAAAAPATPPPGSGLRGEKFHDVEGLSVGITQMDPWSNLGLLSRLIGYVAPAVPQAFKGGKLDLKAAKKKLGDLNVSGFGDALGELFKRLTPDEVELVVKTMLANVTIDEVPAVAVMDTRKMVGRQLALFRILGLVLATEFGPFFAQLLAALPELEEEEGKEGTKTTTASPSSSPTT